MNNATPMKNQNGSQLAAILILATLVLFTLGSTVLRILPPAGTIILLIRSGKGARLEAMKKSHFQIKNSRGERI